MKRFLALLLSGVMPLGQSVLAAPLRMAGESSHPVELPVDARCTVSFASQVIDYGTQSRWQLQESTAGPHAVTPGKRTLMLSVVCPYNQAIRLTLHGERAVNGDVRYGESGSMTLQLLDAQLDGHRVQIVDTTPEGVIRGPALESLRLQPGQTFAPMANGQLPSGKAFTARIEIEPMLSEAAARVASLQSSEARFRLEVVD